MSVKSLSNPGSDGWDVRRLNRMMGKKTMDGTRAPLASAKTMCNRQVITAKMMPVLFSDLLRFRQTPAGIVPPDVVRQLRLPMPDNVLEQFVIDHGTKPEFQRQFGHVDLHAVEWQLSELTLDEIASSSVFSGFQRYVKETTVRFAAIPEKGWESVTIVPEAVQAWRQRRTWRRSPIAMEGTLVGGDKPLHWVEGHTRLGALLGLTRAGLVDRDKRHCVWAGRVGARILDADHWRTVLQREQVSFASWLVRHQGDETPLGTVASELVVPFVKGRLSSEAFDGVIAHLQRDGRLRPFMSVVEAALPVWQKFIEG